MENPKVSIVVPIYNVEKYLHRCIDSLVNQTLKDIEIILVDDESPDNSPKICDEYAQRDSRIKVIHKKNEGLGLTRNAGLAVATGEYVAFIDSDDWVDLTMYEILYTIAQEKQCDTVYCSLQHYYSPSRIVPFKEVETECFFHGREAVDNFLLDMLAPTPEYRSDVKYMVSVCKAIYSRSIIEKHHLRFISERKVASEDMIFHIQYLRFAEHIGFIPEYFYNYYQNQNSITHTYTDAKIERLKKFVIEMDSTFMQYFPRHIYQLRLQRKALHYLRIALYIKFQMVKKEAFVCQCMELGKICNDAIFSQTLTGFPYKKLPMKHKLFFLLTRYKITPLLVLMYKIQK